MVDGGLNEHWLRHRLHVMLYGDQVGLRHVGRVCDHFGDMGLAALNVQGLGMWVGDRRLLGDLQNLVHFRGVDLEV